VLMLLTNDWVQDRLRARREIRQAIEELVRW
jgi:hypothetical protein